MLMLSAIRHFARITLFIETTPLPQPEAQLSTCSENELTVKDELRTATAKVRYIV